MGDHFLIIETLDTYILFKYDRLNRTIIREKRDKTLKTKEKVKAMKKKVFWLGMLAVALVFGMTVVGCGGDEEESVNNTISSVTITGTEKVGSWLSATVKNVSSYSATGVSYQWKRGDTASGAFINITGATSYSYTLVAGDANKFIKLEASNNDTTSPVLSNTLGPIDANQVAKPTASLDSGEVAPGQKVTLSTTTELAQIHYTLDNSTPTSNSNLYSSDSGIEITASCTLKAIATRYYGMSDSEVLTVSYTLMPGIAFSPVTTSVFSSGINAVAYGNNRFVAAGGSIMGYSSNGTSWTASPSSIGTMYGITYGGTRFVAVGSNGRISYSTDGTSWTQYSSTSFETTTINSVAYGNNRFVAVGNNGKIAVIIEGTAGWNGDIWSEITAGTGAGRTQFSTTSYINGVAYGAGKFVAVGSGGQMAFSTDGQAWAAIPNSALTGSINGIAYGGTSGKEKFIAVGSDGLAYSTDGLTWTKITTSFYLSSITPLGTITWGGNKFVAGGYVGVMVYSNADGTSWAKIDGGLGTGKSQFDTTNGGLFASSINDITYGGGNFLAVGTKVGDTLVSPTTGEMAISQ
jgi:hypothetical protein